MARNTGKTVSIKLSAEQANDTRYALMTAALEASRMGHWFLYRSTVRLLLAVDLAIGDETRISLSSEMLASAERMVELAVEREARDMAEAQAA